MTAAASHSATNPQRWQAVNEAYLAAALRWLRALLAGDAAELPGAAGALRAAEAAEPAPALIALSRRFGLSAFERDVLLLCAAMELDPGMPGLCARAHGDPARTCPTFALALSVFDEPAWDALSPERPLRYWRLIEIHQPAAQPLTTSALRGDERIVNAIKGLNYLDDRLAVLLAPVDDETAAALSESQARVAADAARALQAGAAAGRLPLIQLLGPDADSKLAVAARAAGDFGLRLYRLPSANLPAHPAEVESLARLWQRESLLLPLALCVDARDLDAPGRAAGEGGDEGAAARTAAVRSFAARVGGVTFLDTRERWRDLGAGAIGFDVRKPDPTEQRAAWSAALRGAGRAVDGWAAQLAGQFDLSLAAITRIAQRSAPPGDALPGDALPGDAPPGGAPDNRETIWQACLDQARPQLDALAQRIQPKAAWEDLVLPPEETALLRQIADQVRQRSRVYGEWGFADRLNRGLGITALFAGESGTGKSMAAEVIASELRLNLYRIDLSGVVSKYIGETEKNLRRLFDAAEDGGAILLFDEADALFGKRSEVKDSHDRYANIEVNYLLQRMESFRGLAILATNLRSALDPAFLRRLRFVVNFPYPGPRERLRIWRRIFPARMPVDGVDYERLSRLNLSGGNIQSVALNAAFLAAQDDAPVGMPHLMSAARIELRKLERPVNEAELRA